MLCKYSHLLSEDASLIRGMSVNLTAGMTAASKCPPLNLFRYPRRKRDVRHPESYIPPLSRCPDL